MKTIKELAQESLEVQNACNLIAVVNGFSRALTQLKEHDANYRTNPITKVWVDKICSMTNMQYVSVSDVLNAFSNVEKEIES